MKSLADPGRALANGLAAIRREFQVPPGFPPEVLAAAERAAARQPIEHVDRTDRPFVTLDPASSTDLDQAFAIDRSGADLLLHYAIADVAWFVEDGGPIDAEAWRRAETLYLPDGKAGLYPPILSENVASLLPAGPRPAVIFTVRVDPDGEVRLDGAERAVIRSRAKLAYDSVRNEDLPHGFVELAARIAIAEQKRGASRIDPPEQEVARRGDDFALVFRPRLDSEIRNAALSLAANLAVADTLFAHQTGLYRVMPEPDERAVRRLRFTAKAFGVEWPEGMPLDIFEQGLDSADAKHAALMLAIRRAGGGAAYASFTPGILPWHSAMAARYAHATAPLRRLADRYVVRATLAVSNGRPVADADTAAFEALPPIMARADALAAQIDRAVIDLAEAVMLDGKAGQSFSAVVTDADERGARIQLCDFPVVARIAGDGLAPGDTLDVILTKADPERRTIRFDRSG